MTCLPNLLIIGAPKCGTSSLHHYLDQHPRIQMSEPKELNFFTRQKPNSRRGLSWYESHFDPAFPVRGESSGYAFHPYARGAPALAATIVPDARIVYLVGDPIDRIVSHYVHRVAAGRERRSFDRVVGALPGETGAEEVAELPGPPGYLARSLYHMQLEQWRPYFPDSRIHVVDQDRLRGDRAAALAEIAAFLELEPSFPAQGIAAVHNPSAGKRQPSRLGRLARRLGRATGGRALLSERARGRLIGSRSFTRSLRAPAVTADQRRMLTDLLRDDVSGLRAHTGQSFSGWSL
jgi:hypothetical protein